MTTSDEAPPVHIFIDTSVFLEHQPLDQIPWLDLVDAVACVLHVPMVVVRELDAQKDHPKSERKRKRARDALRLFESFDAGSPLKIKERVDLLLEYREANQGTFAAAGLNATISDEHIIARCHELAADQSVPRQSIVIASSDTGLGLKARGHGFRSVNLQGVRQLPAEKTTDQVAREQLQRELRQLRDRRPNLVVTFGTGESILSFRPPTFVPTPAADLESELNAQVLSQRQLIDRHPQQPSDVLYGNTARSEAAYASEYLEYQRRREAWRELDSRTIRFSLRLANLGGGPATVVEASVTGHSPGWFDLTSLARRPTVPERKRSNLLDRPFDFGKMPDLRPRGWILTPESPDQRRLQGGLSSPSILAGGSVTSGGIRLTFGHDQEPDATVNWTAHCAEFSEAASGTLRIVRPEPSTD